MKTKIFPGEFNESPLGKKISKLFDKPIETVTLTSESGKRKHYTIEFKMPKYRIYFSTLKELDKIADVTSITFEDGSLWIGIWPKPRNRY